MNIYFDNIAFSIQKVGGVSAVWAELLKSVPHKYVKGYLEYPGNHNIFRHEMSLLEQKIICKSCFNVKLEKQFDIRIKDNEKFIFHSSSYRLCTSRNALNVVTVHDFIDHYYNKFFLKRQLKKIRQKHCISKADAVICVSDNTKQDLLKIFPKVANEEKIYVIHNGKSEEFRLDKSDLSIHFPEIQSTEYVLFVGSRSGYKNFYILIKAIALYKTKKLVFVGGGNLKKNEKQLLDSALGTDNYFHYQGLPNSALNLLYNHAFCFVYPSLYEGFGIPVIEAQSAGCPVIAVNTSSIPEIVGDSAILLDDITPPAIYNSFFRLEDTTFRQYIIGKGFNNAKKYTWDIMAQAYMDVYRLVWNRNKLSK